MRLAALAGACAWALLGGPAQATPAAAATPAQVALRRIGQEARIAAVIGDLEAQAVHGRILLRNVRVVDPVAETITPGQAIEVANSTIVWVGPMAEAPRLEGAVTVDGGGRFASPGLVDMHVHSSAAAGWLLDLANGVTAVRDMDGFPWLLRLRQAVDQRALLAPVDYVAGPIINAAPLEGYAVTPRNALDARRLVRQQAACGYDFVKIHNVVPKPMFDAIAEEADRLGMDLVGHVPHDIPVRYAVAHGMRTMEHLKGFLNDHNLKLGDTDYAAAVDGAETWVTPTLYAGRAPLRGQEARAFLDGPQARYAPLRDRQAWEASAGQPEDPSDQALRDAAPVIKTIMDRLVAQHARFLAGTDAANYPFQVMGFALVEELRLLQQAGLTPAETLRAATTEPARAMRVEGEFGRIRPGMRADIVLLDANPLDDVAAFRANRGVMAHGWWLARPALDAALERLAAIYAEPDAAVRVDGPAAEAAYAAVKHETDASFVFESLQLTQLAAVLREAGLVETAARFDALADLPAGPPCADVRP